MYIENEAAPLLVGQLSSSSGSMIRLALIMRANGYSFRTYSPDQSDLVSFPAKF